MIQCMSLDVKPIMIKRRKEMMKVFKYWNDSKILGKMIGKLDPYSQRSDNANDYLHTISRELFARPFVEHFNWDKSMTDRFVRELKTLESNFTEGRYSTLRKYFWVPDAIANKTPVGRKFMNDTNRAVNYERNKLDTYLSAAAGIRTALRNEMITRGVQGKLNLGIKTEKEMMQFMNDVLQASQGGEKTKALTDMQRIIDSEGGKVFTEYVTLMELNKEGLGKAYKNNTYEGIDDNGSPIRFEITSDMRMAVDKSRQVLNDMGGVLIGGLHEMNKTVKLIYGDKGLSKSVSEKLISIDNAIETVTKGIEKGGYLPHYSLESVVELNHRMRDFVEVKKSLAERETILGQVIDKLQVMIPDQARGRNNALKTLWVKNPFWVLDQYSKDVIAFNKINFIQNTYFESMRKFQKDDVNPEFVTFMREWLDDTYTVATRGLHQRPNWVNATVRTLMGVETLKSMGLSVTGALRNAASALYFFTELGVHKIRQAKKDYQLTEYRQILDKVEGEQGFVFAEAGSELIAEGLLPSTANTSDISFDPVTQKVSYKDKGVLKYINPMASTVVAKSLIFHRFTENMTRNWMFRMAFIDNFKQYQGTNMPKDQAVRESTDYALRMVNKFAFEYAAHAKARAIGGTAPKLNPKTGVPEMAGRDYATAAGELVFQFMHFPMSFLNLQSQILKSSGQAMLSGQWKDPAIRQMLGFAGISMGTYAMSVLTNLDFTNIIENDTVNRVKDLVQYNRIGDEEFKKEKRGLINDFTGPVVGDMLYAVQLAGWMDLPETVTQKILRGNIDYSKEFDPLVEKDGEWVENDPGFLWEKRRHFWNKISTSGARFVTRHIPAIKDGKGMSSIMAELGLYPTKELKQAREWVGLDKPKLTTHEKNRLKRHRYSLTGLEDPESIKRLKNLAQALLDRERR